MITTREVEILCTILDMPVIKGVNCGDKCRKHSSDGKTPACCENLVCMPSASAQEWKGLKTKRDKTSRKQWKPWRPGRSKAHQDLLKNLGGDPSGYIVCTGPEKCKRESRSLVCHVYPFVPYSTVEGEFVGMAAIQGTERACWVAQNLERVDPEFAHAFEMYFRRSVDLDWRHIPGYHESSRNLRNDFAHKGKKVPVILFEGYIAHHRAGLLDLQNEDIVNVFKKARKKRS